MATVIPPTAQATPSGMWPYSQQFASVVEEGHRRPPPSFGAPTLVWHLGIWLRSSDRTGTSWPTESLPEEMVSYEHLRKSDFEEFDERNVNFFGEFSHFLASLQERGRILRAPIQTLQFTRPTHHGPSGNVVQEPPFPFQICNPQSVNFTLWWQDGAGAGRINSRQESPSASDMRVRVQAQTHLDHATISFFIDVGKPWNGEQIFSIDDATGERRRAVFEHVEGVKRICDKQIVSGYVDYDRFPEHGISEDDAAALDAAAEFCYDTVWRQFLRAFDLETVWAPDRGSGSRLGELFAEFRGAVISVDGIETPENRDRREKATTLRQKLRVEESKIDHYGASATYGFGEFEKFDNDNGEPNTVLKAYWPFIRRTVPGADERDFIACGINEWRDLYVTSLGAPLDACVGDETSSLSPVATQGSTSTNGSMNADVQNPRPVRYLFLTKHEPHRLQIGRFVERINAIGTMRLFALKNWETIRNASTHIRLIGHELDSILSEWSVKRRTIDFEFSKLRVVAELRHKRVIALKDSSGFKSRRKPRNLVVAEKELQKIDDERLKATSRLISDTESRLLSLGAALDGIGQGGSGQLLYVINRSSYFIKEFHRMASTLEVGNIDTWINYSQFVDRGLRPTFDFIVGTGERFVSLRGRLQMVSEMIQTSALIVEAEATRVNTEILRQIATHWYWAQWGLLAVAAEILLNLFWNVLGNELTGPVLHLWRTLIAHT